MARVLISLILVCSPVLAEELLWPLPFGKVITGGFADSRPDHFHGGVDLRTGPEPRQVIAPTGGYVERIAVAPNGYGRTLYFRLSDGRTAVFGHLSRFVPRIESMVRDSQLVAGTFRVDFATDSTERNVWFQRGETICYTGQSGLGPPHLHFEIRAGAVQTDPLANYSPRDSQKPVITMVRWLGLENFSPESAGIPLSTTTTVPHIDSQSPVAFFIQCYDPGPWGRHAVPQEIRVVVDGRTIFTQPCGRIDLLGPKDIYEQVVWAERVADRDVRRLFVPPMNSVSAALPAGWISGSGPQDVSIQVVDRAGNLTSRHIVVSAESRHGVPPHSDQQFATGSFQLLCGNDPLASWSALTEIAAREVSLTPSLNGFGDRVKLQYRLSGQPQSGQYFYQVRGNGSRRPLWRIPTESQPDVMSCYIMKAGTYGVASDYSPPVLTVNMRQQRIHFTLNDSESGIDDNTIRCRVDGVTAIAEYEYEEDGGFIWTQTALTRGRHDIEFTAADRAGNVNSWRESLRVP